MNQRQQRAITDFTTSIQELKDAGVIRSDRYLGDLAEFLCADAFGIDLATNLRQTGHDGTHRGLRAQIKYGGGTKKNIDLGDPDTYEEIFVVLGRDSAIRDDSHDADFIIYKLTSDEVLAMGKNNAGGYSCGKTPFLRLPDETIYLFDGNDT